MKQKRLGSWLKVMAWIVEHKYEWIEEAERALEKNPALTPKKSSQGCIQAYCEQFKSRYGVNPPITQKAAGQFKTLLKSFPEDQICFLLTTYLQMNDQFFLRTRHSVDAFITNLNSITVAAQTGKVITLKQAQQAESMDSTFRAAKEYLKATHEP